MNISNSSNAEFNSSDYDNEEIPDVVGYEVGFTIIVLISLSINFNVIWLIVTGAGNGLAAEFFILNLSVCEILQCMKTILVNLTHHQMPWILMAFLDGTLIGYHLFECLICVERYLAVVHPVIFLKYKHLRYRLMCSAVVWGIIFIIGGIDVIIMSLDTDVYFIILMAPFLVFLSVKLFCCVAVLRVLKQSGPGERGREREEENHMKKRAFHLILIATLSMFIINCPYFILIAVIRPESNIIFVFVGWICFFVSGSVQPVFFVYRVRKLNFIRCQ